MTNPPSSAQPLPHGPEGPTPIVQIQGIHKIFKNGLHVLNDIHLDIFKGEFFALLGPSGCGKTTLLRILAGLEIPTHGKILIQGVDMATIPPYRRPTNMVFQSYAVFPHMSVEENVAYGLKVEHVPTHEIKIRTAAALELVKLGGYEKRSPEELSGGQKQRVALARALIKKPKVLLLDEPLSALDAKLRDAMRMELVHLQKTIGITFIIVTHDQDEALSMASRIAILNKGIVEQVGTPERVYERPHNRFVADFIGKINLLSGTSAPDGDHTLVTLEMADKTRVCFSHPATPISSRTEPINVALRPEKIYVQRVKDLPTPPKDNGRVYVSGHIKEIVYYGGYQCLFIEVGLPMPLMAHAAIFPHAPSQPQLRSQPSLSVGEEMWCSWLPEDSLLLDS